MRSKRVMATAINNPTLAVQAPRVLIVEDQADERQFMMESVSAEGFQCITAATVAEAIDILRNQSVELMVMDWGLDRCGAEVLQAARVTHPHLPVVVVAGRDPSAQDSHLLYEKTVSNIQEVKAREGQVQTWPWL